jgi:tight adherence protein C
MNELTLLLSFFLFIMGAVVCLGGLWLWRIDHVATAEASAAGLRGYFLAFVQMLGEALPNPVQSPAALRRILTAAGYRHASAPTFFYGAKWSVALILGIVLAWVGLLVRQDSAAAVLLSLCGLGLGYLLPDRMLVAFAVRRAERIDHALPASLDLMVLSIESGQPLDSALSETGRELRDLFPDLSSELAQVQLELRAGRARSEVLRDLGARTNSSELKKVAAILIDTDRFGTSLAPALRTHARYLRTRRRHQAQESARKLGVKLIFPVFFLIMPSVFVVTLGPAVIQIYNEVLPLANSILP